MLEWIKGWIKKLGNWVWVILLGILTLFLMGRKPDWVKEKEKDIKDRDKQLDKIREEREQNKAEQDANKPPTVDLPDLEEMVGDQNEKIEQAGKYEPEADHEYTSDANILIDYLRDVLSRPRK